MYILIQDILIKKTIQELELCQMKVKDDGIITSHNYWLAIINEGLAYGLVPAVN